MVGEGDGVELGDGGEDVGTGPGRDVMGDGEVGAGPGWDCTGDGDCGTGRDGVDGTTWLAGYDPAAGTVGEVQALVGTCPGAAASGVWLGRRCPVWLGAAAGLPACGVRGADTGDTVVCR